MTAAAPPAHDAGVLLYDIAAEEAVIASLMVDSKAIQKVQGIVRPQDFYREQHRWAYEASLALRERGESINTVTVGHEISRSGAGRNGSNRLEEMGGPGFLSRIVGELPTAIGVEHYADIVHRDAVYRDLAGVSAQINQLACQGGPDLEAVLARAAGLLEPLRKGVVGQRFTPLSVADWVADERPEDEADQFCDELHIPQGSVGIISADAGSLKTFILWELELSATNGRLFVGRFEVAARRALILDAENPEQPMRDRVRRHAAGHEDSLDRVDYLRMPSLDLAIRADGEALLALVEKRGYDFLGIDSLRRFHSADENESGAMAGVMGVLRRIAETGAVVVALHHPRKPQHGQTTEPLHRAAGSRDIMASADWGWALSKLGEGRILVQDAKSRWAPPFPPFAIRIVGDPELGEPITISYEGSADEAPDKKQTALVRVKELLGSGGPKSRAAIIAALKAEGFKKRTIEDALGEGVGTEQIDKRKQGKEVWFSLPGETLL